MLRRLARSRPDDRLAAAVDQVGQPVALVEVDAGQRPGPASGRRARRCCGCRCERSRASSLPGLNRVLQRVVARRSWSTWPAIMHPISRPQDSRFPYLPGIDALRAIAVLAVFFYHAHVSWMPGGFLGVDVFFVISGYLITSLLLREFRRGGHVHLGRFWLRRAQRLLARGRRPDRRQHDRRGDSRARPDRLAARRRPLLALLLRQLALHLQPPVLLRTVPGARRCSPTSGRSRSRSSSTSSGRSSSPPE